MTHDGVRADAALQHWRQGAAKQAIVDFVGRVTGADGSAPIPLDERIAVFDNDGTLWAEKPMPSQLDFILRRLREMAEADPSLRDRQPWQAAYTKDYRWLGSAIAKHYAGDDSDLPAIGAGVLSAFAGMTVEDFEAGADAFLRTELHPTLGRPYVGTGYLPMIELLDYLTANGFANYIASGGGRDFMRPISQEMYGISRDRVIGSSAQLAYAPDERGGTISHTAAPEYLDDGPQKPIRIWSRTGRRPLLAAGNSNGDIQMLDFAQHRDKPSLRILVLHDDAEREFDYATGAELALERARTEGWSVVSVKDDWTTVFA
jgi:phosphoglycolate phosphatase-like HAD superfamily hydrolase